MSKTATEFPKTLAQFERRFGTEEKCRRYLRRVRWADGFRCPKCSHSKCWLLSRREIWVCASCENHCSLRSGTLFDKSPVPLTTWFRAIFETLTSKGAISAKELQRIMGFGSYKTAWTWLHKIRQCMAVADDGGLLGSVVEIDEMEVGPRLSRERGRKSANKVIVVGAVEEHGKGCGRVRLRVVEDRTRRTLHGFIDTYVPEDAIVSTDNKREYDGAPKVAVHRVRTTSTGTGYQRKARSGKHVSELHLPRINVVFSLIKRRLMGTYHGSVQKRHMQAYLDEFSFQFNRRRLGDPCLAIPDLIATGAHLRPKTYRDLVHSASTVPGLEVKSVKSERERPSQTLWWKRLRDRIWDEA